MDRKERKQSVSDLSKKLLTGPFFRKSCESWQVRKARRMGLPVRLRYRSYPFLCPLDSLWQKV